MPHFGIMDEDALGDVNAAITRTKLHIRSAKRRLLEGKISHGIATYWDAVIYGLRWYYYVNKDRVASHEEIEIYYPEKLFPLLLRSGVLKTKFNFNYWFQVAEDAIDHPLSDYDPTELMEQFELLFTDLGIWPFDESVLPDEMVGLY